MKIKTCVMALLLCHASHAETVFLADFERGLDAAYSTGDTKACHAIATRPGDVTAVEGKFGQGVKIGREIPAYALYYVLPKDFSWKEGTIEFWFKPDWDCKTMEQSPQSSESLRGSPLYAFLFASGSSPDGVVLSKNQYNNLGFAFSKGYQDEALAWSGIAYKNVFERDQWVHLASSWDKNEGRIFANGKLLAVSDKWDAIAWDFGNKFALGCQKYGVGNGAGGVFDELRISNHKRYISSFPLPAGPCSVENKIPAAKTTRPVGNKPPVSTNNSGGAQSQILFHLDFADGLAPNTAEGSAQAWTNFAAQFAESDGKKYLRMDSGTSQCGHTLCYESGGNLNLFLGTFEIKVRLKEKPRFPAMLFDATRLSSRGLSGVRFFINAQGKLEWHCLEKGQVLAKLTAAAMLPAGAKTLALGFSWGNGNVSIYLDNAPVAGANAVPLPSELGRYFFIGSNCEATDTLAGMIESVKITLAGRPIGGPAKQLLR